MYDIDCVRNMENLGYQWYRQGDSSGTGLEAIAGADELTYTLTDEDEGKYIYFEVIPKAAGSIAGEVSDSWLIGPIKKVDDEITAISDIQIIYNEENLLTDFSADTKQYTARLALEEDNSLITVAVTGGEDVSINGVLGNESVVDFYEAQVIEIQSKGTNSGNITSYYVILDDNSKPESLIIDGIDEVNITGDHDEVVFWEANIFDQYGQMIENEINWSIPEGYDYSVNGDYNQTLIFNIPVDFPSKSIVVKASLTNDEEIYSEKNLIITSSQSDNKTYTVSIDNIIGGSITSDLDSASEGDVVRLTVIPDSDKELVEDSLKYYDGEAYYGITGNSFIMPASDVIITGEFKSINNDDRSNKDNDKNIRVKVKTEVNKNEVKGKIVTTATYSNGNAAASITNKQIADAVNKVVSEIKKQNKALAAIVEINADIPNSTRNIEISMPQNAMMELSENNIDFLTVSSQVAEITFDKNAVSAINNEAAGDIKITASKEDIYSLTDEMKEIIGDRPVYNFSVISGNKTISEFEGGNVTVSVPYSPKAGEDISAVVIYYINSDGNLETISNCIYNPETGKVTFKTNHFSEYAVGYNKVCFNDVTDNAWYSDAVSFIAARNIVNGMGDGNYKPEAKLTRGQFIVMVMRAYGIEPDSSFYDNFTDAGDTYYTDYLAAAKRLGITKGTGNNCYDPDREIIRQEMFTLLYNTLKVINKLPEVTTEKQITAFSDSNLTADWAEEAMMLFIETGIIIGNNGKINPNNSTNRAEMAQVLYNLLSEF